MMKAIFGSTAIAAILLAGCAAPEVEAVNASAAAKATEPDADAPRTVKPGAAVEFSHLLRAKVDPGEDGVLTITVKNGYKTGTLSLRASSESVDIYPTSIATSFDLGAADNHQWDVYFTARDAGVHYINIHATAEKDGAVMGARAYSARISVGDNAVRNLKSQAETVINENGDSMIMMEAEETIEQ